MNGGMEVLYPAIKFCIDGIRKFRFEPKVLAFKNARIVLLHHNQRFYNPGSSPILYQQYWLAVCFRSISPVLSGSESVLLVIFGIFFGR